MKPFAEKLYKSYKWQKISKAYMTSQNYICERCGGVGTVCHHRTHLTPDNIDNPKIAYGFDNLECLCHDCHRKEHEVERHPRSIMHYGLDFDENGDLVKSPDVFIVCGSPGSGKSHYVKEHRRENDIVVDFDYLCAALACSEQLYFNHLPVIKVALEVREFLYQLIEDRASRWGRAWVITAEPDVFLQKQLAYRLKGEIITIEKTPEECKANIMNDDRRPPDVKKRFFTLVDEWYDKNQKSIENYMHTIA